MKKTLYILSLLALLLTASCTRNHGDIGPWFGTWHVETITADGTPVTVVGDYFFQFQSGVFRVSQVYGHEQLVESFGTWDDSTPGQMTISFPDPDVFYIEMPGLEAHNTFTVTHTSSREVTFTTVPVAGAPTFSYQLKKQP